jgi:hypothetical protein
MQNKILIQKFRFFFCILKVTDDFGTDPHPDPFVRGTDSRIRIGIRIRTKCHGSGIGTLLFSAVNC